MPHKTPDTVISSTLPPSSRLSLWLTIGTIMLLVIGGVGLVLVLGQQPKGVVTNGKVKVVAAENFWGNIAAQIGGDHADVTSIITDPNSDPHLYESDARDAEAIAQANLVIENGLGYDDFMDKLLAASPNSERKILSAQQILGVTGDNPN